MLKSLSMSMFHEVYPLDGIRYRGNSFGIFKDCVLILNAWKNITFPQSFHIEIIKEKVLIYEWFFPNLEFLHEEALRSIKCETVACKTHECFRHLKDRLPKKRVIYTGFTSEDLYDPQYTKDYNQWLHIAGKSDYKGTLILLEAWKKHPEWPTLTVLYKGADSDRKIKKWGKELENVRLVNRFVDDKEIKKLVNTSGIHIYPCIVEGFGHTLNEVRSAKGVALYTNGGAMAEFFKEMESGIPIHVHDDSTRMGMAQLQKVSVKTIEDAIHKAQKLSREQLERIGEKARLSFIQDRAKFKKRMLKCAFRCEDHHVYNDIPLDYGASFQTSRDDISKSKIGIVMPTFGRPEVLEECLNSLGGSDLTNATVIIVDESATKLNPLEIFKTHKIISQFKPNVNVLKIFKRKHGNMFDSIKTAIDHLTTKGISYFTILDSDTLVHPNWLTELQSVYKLNQTYPRIVTGFNTTSNNHHTLQSTGKYRIKQSIGGINMFFDKDTYLEYIRPNLIDKDWDWRVCNSVTHVNGILMATKPSVVNHIGVYGINSSSKTHDRATDFIKKQKLEIDKELAKKFCSKDTSGCSQWDQAGILSQIFNQIGTTNKFFVEFGARRPDILNSSYFRIHEGWKGVLLDGDPSGNAPNCNGKNREVDKLLKNDESQKVIMRKEFITKENVNQIFHKYNVPLNFDLLTIDIDKNEYHVIDGLDMDRFSPRVVCLEFSSYFTKTQDCVPKYNPKGIWDGVSITNSSLAALDRLMRTKGYSYIDHASGEHAIFVKNSELVAEDQNYDLPNVEEGWQYKVRKSEQNKRYHPHDFSCRSTV